MLLILCFSIKITALQGVNIFLISHPTIVHLKCQIGLELSLSFMYDIELIRVRRDTSECVIPVILRIVERAQGAEGLEEEEVGRLVKSQASPAN